MTNRCDFAHLLAPSCLVERYLSGGLHVNRQFGPEGTELGTQVHALHHEEQCYPDAFTSKPAGWHLGAPGAAPDETETSILLAMMIFLFDLRLSQSSRPEKCKSSWPHARKRKNGFHNFESIVAMHDGPMTELKRRG